MELIFDTVAGGGGFCLCASDWHVCSGFANLGNSDLLPAAVEQVLFEKKCSPLQINRVFFNRGPGSFTGIKTGYVFAHGFCCESGVSPLSFTTFDRLYLASGRNDKALYVMNAFQDDIFLGRKTADGWDYIISKRSFLQSEEAQRTEIICLGDSFSVRPGVKVLTGFEPESLLQLSGSGLYSSDTTPLYLKKSTAEIKAGHKGV
jgi:tRNA A37 threonylcarbamoyladenosine modification protein TsaB